MTDREEKNYYAALLEELAKDRRLMANCALTPCYDMELPDYHELYALLDQVEAKYEFDLQKIVRPNHMHFTLWQQSFYRGYDLGAVLAATEFVLFCCLADKILDSGRFSKSEKDAVCEKLDVARFFSAVPYESTSFYELDTLLNHVRMYLASCNFSKNDVDWLKAHMQRAVDSEIFMYRYPLREMDCVSEEKLHLLTDKSVEFEMIAFLLADKPPISSDAVNAANCIGKLLWLIDDLWDLPEDVKLHRKNSLLFLCPPYDKVLPIEDRVAQARAHMKYYTKLLGEHLVALEAAISEELFQCIRWELQNWSKHAKSAAKQE